MAANRKPIAYPLMELVSAALGLAITAGMFGFLAYEALLQRDGVAPLMEAVPVTIVAGTGVYVVEADIRNVSHSTGADVQVEGSLKRGGETVETSNATVDYVPGGSSRRVGLLFTQDPRNFALEVRVTGYERP